MIKNQPKIRKAWNRTKIALATMLAGIAAKESFIPNKLLSKDVEKQFVGHVIDQSSGLSLEDVIVKINSNGHTVQDTTTGSGDYDVSITYTGINDSDDNGPKQFELLKQNYPNPFNPGTTIPVFGNGLLTIYNALGQIVFSNNISNDQTINLKGLASGIYFAKYNNNLSEIKKMVLLDGGDVKIFVDHSPKTRFSGLNKNAVLNDDPGDSTRYELSKEGFFGLDTTLLTFEGLNEHDFSLTPIPVVNWYVLQSVVRDAGSQEGIANVVVNYLPSGFAEQNKMTNQEGIAVTDTIWTTNNSIDMITNAGVDGYEDRSDTLTITPGDNRQFIDLSKLPPTVFDYVVKGQITDHETSQGLEGVLVTILSGGLVDSVYSDVDGFYVGDTIKTVDERIDVDVNAFKDGYEDFANSLFGITPGVTTQNIELNKIPEDHEFSGTMFNQRGITITDGVLKLIYDGIIQNINIGQDGKFSATVPANIDQAVVEFEHDDYTEYLAVRTPNQGPSAKNITQSNYLHPEINLFVFDSAKVNLNELDSNPQKNNLWVYSVADSALDDTVRSIISHYGSRHKRFTEPYTVEIITVDQPSGGPVPAGDTEQRILLVEDNKKNAVLKNQDTLITMNYILVGADGVGHQPNGTFNWVTMYQSNEWIAGHSELQDDTTNPFRITYGENSIKASNNFNTMGEEYYGNHFPHDGLSISLGGYCITQEGTLNYKGKDMFGIVYLFNPGTIFNPEQIGSSTTTNKTNSSINWSTTQSATPQFRIDKNINYENKR